MTSKNSLWGSRIYRVTNRGAEPFSIRVKGRDRWALENLINAGDAGCTPIDNPAPRWSAYVFKLRSFRVKIETVHEEHTGPFSGTHARYVLRSEVSCPERDTEAAA